MSARSVRWTAYIRLEQWRAAICFIRLKLTCGLKGLCMRRASERLPVAWEKTTSAGEVMCPADGTYVELSIFAVGTGERKLFRRRIGQRARPVGEDIAARTSVCGPTSSAPVTTDSWERGLAPSPPRPARAPRGCCPLRPKHDTSRRSPCLPHRAHLPTFRSSQQPAPHSYKGQFHRKRYIADNNVTSAYRLTRSNIKRSHFYHFSF